MKSLIAAAALATTLLAAAPGHALTAASEHRYVAGNAYSGVVELASDASGVALQGMVKTRARSDRITITIDDDVVSRATIHVAVTGGSAVQHLCVVEGTPTTISGLTPGSLTYLWIHDATFRNRCAAGATTGVLRVSG